MLALRRSKALRSVAPVPGKSWVGSIFDSFESHERSYKIASALDISDQSETPLTTVLNPREEADRRYRRLTFMKKLLIGAPQTVGFRRAWDIYRDALAGNAEYIEKLYGKNLSDVPDFADLDDFKSYHRIAVSVIKREEEKAKAPKRRKAGAENEGYSEPVMEPVLEHWRFQPENVTKSLVEDKWKSDNYASLCERIEGALSTDSHPVDSDEFFAVLGRATERFLRTESRPVLTNELADFANPFMMKKATTERLLHERCVRNKLEESLVPTFLSSQPALVKLRSRAGDLPPETLEPLQAFRGVVDWSFDPEKRMHQKLVSLEAFLMIKKSKPNSPNAGFESVVPKGRLGGWGQGKPVSCTKAELARTRYPTLERVAHSLPKDPQYRSQAMHAIQVLERSRGWTFEDKTKAVNAFKEVLDALPSSQSVTRRLDTALPPVRYSRFAPGTLRSSHKFVRRKPSNLRRRNRIRMYFRSMTASTPLARRWADRKSKNLVRSKKKQK